MAYDKHDDDIIRRQCLAKDLEDSARLISQGRMLQQRFIANAIRMRAADPDLDPKVAVAFVGLAAWLEEHTGPIVIDDE